MKDSTPVFSPISGLPVLINLKKKKKKGIPGWALLWPSQPGIMLGTYLSFNSQAESLHWVLLTYFRKLRFAELN
jgi:hypothetical protein